MRWIPARRHPARGEADGLWRWRLLWGPLRLGWPVPPRAAAARAIGPGSIRTARRSPWPASGRPPSRPGSAATRGIPGAEANAAAEPVATRSDLAAAREPLARPEPTITGAIAPAPDDEARTAKDPSSPVLRAADRPAKRPTLRKARLAPAADRVRTAPGQESCRRRTRRRRQARSGADRVECPRAAPRIAGGGREYPPRVGRGGRAGTACQRLPLLRCLFLDALASAAKGPFPCRETEEDEMCQRRVRQRQLDQALCRLCDRGRGSAGPVDQPTSGTALPMTRASSSLEAVLSRKAIGSAAAARCRVSSSE